MKSKQTPIRVFGQCSITSSFLSRCSNSYNELKDDFCSKDAKKLSSLSDFLNRKLPRSSGNPKTVQEKSRPFSSLLHPKEVESVDKLDERRKEDETDKSKALDKVVFEQFKQDNAEKVDVLPNSGGEEEAETPAMDEVQNSSKRHNPFQGIDEGHRTRKPFLVLGDDPQCPKKRRKRECSTSKNKPKLHYNHYANGCGWWDCDMEGVDDEEVGYGEVWEGVGSTTFGGIVDWH